jgi:hypothetical protein
MAVQNVLTETGMSLRNPFGLVLANYGAKTELFASGSTQNKAIIDASGLSVVQGNVTRSIFGSDITIGRTDSTNQNLVIDSNAIKIRQGTTNLITIGNVSFEEPVVAASSDRQAFTTTTNAAIISPSASFQSLKVDKLLPNISYSQKAFNLDSTNLRGFSYIESSSNAGGNSENLRGNFRVDYTGLYTGGSQEASDVNDSPFRFTATYDANNASSIRLGELDGGVFDIKLNLNGTNTYENKLGSAFMITVDDNTNAAATDNDGYSFIHCKGSMTGSGIEDRFQVSGSGDVIAFGNITAFGTAFASVSDREWKKDIETFSGSLNKVLELRPRKFKWKKDDKEDYGFIAQEVEKIIPNVVQSQGFSKAGKNTGDSKKHKTIDYAKLTPYLVDTIQELSKRVKELEEKIK